MLWWTVQNVVVTAVLAAVVWTICRAARVGPVGRHALWLLVLAKLVTPPLVAWPWAVAPAFGGAVARQTGAGDAVRRPPPPPAPAARAQPGAGGPSTATREPAVVASAASPSPGDADGRFAPDAEPVVPEAVEGDPPAAARAGHADAGPTAPARQAAAALDPPSAPADPLPASVAAAGPVPWVGRVVPAAGAAWAAGAGAYAAVQAVRIARMRRRLRRTAAPAPPPLVRLVDQVARRLGVRPVPVVVVPGLGSPAVWAVARPTLLWPAELPADVPTPAVRGLIAHELAHVRRRDHWVGWLELVAGVAWWWNPLFWYVRHQLRENAELACDGWAVDALPDGRRAYAEGLLAVCECVCRRAAPPPPAVGVTTGGRQFLERRLAMILRDRVSLRLPRLGLLTVGLLGLTALPAWSQRAPEDPAAPTPAPAVEPERTTVDPTAAPGERPDPGPRLESGARSVPDARPGSGGPPGAPGTSSADGGRGVGGTTPALPPGGVGTAGGGMPGALPPGGVPGSGLPPRAMMGGGGGAMQVPPDVRQLMDEHQKRMADATLELIRGLEAARDRHADEPQLVAALDAKIRNLRDNVGLRPGRAPAALPPTPAVPGMAPQPFPGRAGMPDNPGSGFGSGPSVPPGAGAGAIPGNGPIGGIGGGGGGGGMVAAITGRRPPLPDPGTLVEYRGQANRTFTFEVVGKAEGTVWGSDVYTDDSPLAVAAVHAGLVRPGDKALVRVQVLPGQDSYKGSSKNGVTSGDYGAWPGSYRVEPPPERTGTYRGPRQPGANGIKVSPNPGTLLDFQQQVGQSFNFDVTGSTEGTVWGNSDAYTTDSPLATAAVHAGVLKAGEQGVVRVTIQPGRDSFPGSAENGVTSQRWGPYPGSYRVSRVVVSSTLRPPATGEPAAPPALSGFRGQAGVVVTVDTVGSIAGPLWGSDVYTDDSSIAAAAVHAGVLKDGERGVVRVTILPGQAEYTGTTRNGVASAAYGTWPGSFKVDRGGQTTRRSGGGLGGGAEGAGSAGGPGGYGFRTRDNQSPQR